MWRHPAGGGGSERSRDVWQTGYCSCFPHSQLFAEQSVGIRKQESRKQELPNALECPFEEWVGKLAGCHDLGFQMETPWEEGALRVLEVAALGY